MGIGQAGGLAAGGSDCRAGRPLNKAGDKACGVRRLAWGGLSPPLRGRDSRRPRPWPQARRPPLAGPLLLSSRWRTSQFRGWSHPLQRPVGCGAHGPWRTSGPGPGGQRGPWLALGTRRADSEPPRCSLGCHLGRPKEASPCAPPTATLWPPGPAEAAPFPGQAPRSRRSYEASALRSAWPLSIPEWFPHRGLAGRPAPGKGRCLL